MIQPIGYIYIRNHPSYHIYDACKLGKATNIPERDSNYATGEIIRGSFDQVFEVHSENLGDIEKLLQSEFQEFNIKYDAGTEFYNTQIITLIEPFFQENGIIYKKLTKNDIDDLLRPNRIKDNKYTPREEQRIIIETASKYFQKNNKGILVIPCGVGKTLISLWTTIELRLNTILIGVPNILLLLQWKNIISELFPNTSCLTVSNGIYIENITSFLINNWNKCIVITTYSSSHKLYKATQNIFFEFDMKILDEVHHLTSISIADEYKKTYINMLKIKSDKQLSLTATLKILENQENKREEDIVISNDSVIHFGEIIDRKCLLWAITKNIICDYLIQTFVGSKEELDKLYTIEEDDKQLFLSAFAALKSIYDGYSHHILIYSNNKENCEKIIQYIKNILEDKYFDMSEIYYSDYHSEMKSIYQKDILNNFDKSKFAIISCVYCLGEGYDNHNIDAVVFAENMGSNIRIVQSALRASRKNKNEPDKITKIILPILDDNSELKQIRDIIYQMSLEDETIIQKIKVFRLDIKKFSLTRLPKKSVCDNNYDEELTQKLRLKTIKRSVYGTTYEKARQIIMDKNIRNKEEYFELCEKDNRLSNEPEVIYEGRFTSWIEYLSIKRIYYDLKTCIEKINELLNKHNEIKKNYLDLSIICFELCKLDPMFPPHGLWAEYYNVKDLQDIIIYNYNKKKNGAAI